MCTLYNIYILLLFKIKYLLTHSLYTHIHHLERQRKQWQVCLFPGKKRCTSSSHWMRWRDWPKARRIARTRTNYSMSALPLSFHFRIPQSNLYWSASECEPIRQSPVMPQHMLWCSRPHAILMGPMTMAAWLPMTDSQQFQSDLQNLPPQLDNSSETYKTVPIQ